MTKPSIYGTPTTGLTAASLTFTVTLPTYTFGVHPLVMLVMRNGTDGTAVAGDANVTVTELANSGTRRMTALLLTPANGSVNSFTATFHSSQINRWWCFAIADADASKIFATAGPSQNDSTTAIPFNNAFVPYTTDGQELILGAAGANATVTWTTDGNTVFNTTTGSCPMMVEKYTSTAGLSSIPIASVTRSSGTVNEASIVIVFTAQVTNTLVCGDMEEGSTIAGITVNSVYYGWIEEHSTPAAATYSLSATTGIVRGSKSQRMQWSGVGNGKKVEEYQDVNLVYVAGQSVMFSVWLSGTIVDAEIILAVESHDASNVWLAERSISVSVSGTATQFSVVFNNLPAGTQHVVVAILAANLGPTASVDLYMDRAELTLAPGLDVVDLPVLDNFNRADSTTTLGSNWSLLDDFAVGGGLGQQGILSNQAYNPASAFSNYAAVYWIFAFGANCAVGLTISTVHSNTTFGFVLYLRLQQPGHSTHDGYAFVYDKTDGLGYIARIDNGVFIPLGATFPMVVANGDKTQLMMVGSVLAACQYTGGAWKILACRTDSTYPNGGFLGIYFPGDVVDGRYDDFSGTSYLPVQMIGAQVPGLRQWTPRSGRLS